MQVSFAFSIKCWNSGGGILIGIKVSETLPQLEEALIGFCYYLPIVGIPTLGGIKTYGSFPNAVKVIGEKKWWHLEELMFSSVSPMPRILRQKIH